jgi:hypothetical protein
MEGVMLVPLFAVLALAVGDPKPETPARCVRYFALEEIKAEALRKVLPELGTPDEPARFVTGPSTATCRPKLSFVAIDVSDSMSGKDVARALKKGCKVAEELVWTTFRGVDRPLPSIMGVSSQDCVIGMASDMRWFETKGDAKHFYYVPGKLDAASIAKQFQNLFQPFNAGDIGTLATESLTIELPADADAAAVKRATKAIAKIDGVRKVEVLSSSIVVEAELDELHASAVSADGAKSSPGLHTKPIFDAIAKEKIAVTRR